MPDNIFLNISDLSGSTGKQVKINRLLIDNKSNITTGKAHDILMNIMKPSDFGLRIKHLTKPAAMNLDQTEYSWKNPLSVILKKLIPSAAPVITYLANSISYGSRSVPYSFVAALPGSLYPDIAAGNGIIVNKWLADDLSASQGDTLTVNLVFP